MGKTDNDSHDVTDIPDVLEEDVEEIGQWLEIDGETIVGVHSHRCQSELIWIKYEGDDEVMPGYQWKKNKIVQPKVEIDEEQLRAAARKHISDTYPLWKQLNILREGDQKRIEKMGRFIDATRIWSNDPKAKITELKKIKP